MVTMPDLTKGTLITAVHWNAHADQINTNTTAIADHNNSLVGHEARIDDLELSRSVGIVLRKNADQMILKGPGTADQVITWQTVQAGTSSMKSGDTVVIPSAGRYLVSANINLRPIGDVNNPGGAGNVPGEAVLYITVNTATDVFAGSVAAFGQPGQVSGGLGNGLSTSTVRQFAAGDVLRVLVYQSSDRDRPARPTAFGGCTFAVAKVS